MAHRNRWRARPGRRRTLVHVAVASAVLRSATAGTTVYVRTQAHGATALVSKVATAEEGSVSPSPTPSPAASAAVDRDSALAAAVRAAAAGHDGPVSVAVLDVAAGTSAVYASGDGTYDTASVVKVDVLCALLLRAQDEGRALTAQERTYATAMIERSDNAAATALWDVIGGADGLDAANERLGLTQTRGGNGPFWGLTQTTAADQLLLLRQVFGVGDSALGAASRAYVQELMGNVVADQAWGVSAAGSGGRELKNGWLRRSTTELWDINSVGRIDVAGSRYLVAVLSAGNPAEDGGIALVEGVAKAAVRALSDAG